MPSLKQARGSTAWNKLVVSTGLLQMSMLKEKHKIAARAAQAAAHAAVITCEAHGPHTCSSKHATEVVARAATASWQAETKAAEAVAAVCRSMEELQQAEENAAAAHDEYELAVDRQQREAAVLQAGILRRAENFKLNLCEFMSPELKGMYHDPMGPDQLDRFFIKIFEVGVSPRIFCFLDAEVTWTISTLKAKLQDKEGIPVDKTKIFYCNSGDELKDDIMLLDYGIDTSDHMVCAHVLNC